MATFTKSKSGKWKAEVRRTGWPRVYKTFRIKRDAEDWARVTEDEIIRGHFVPRHNSEKITQSAALERYKKEVIPTKKLSGQRREMSRADFLKSRLGQYSLAALSSEIIAEFRDARLDEGKANNTVRIELALLSHMFTVAIQEWGLGLTVNPVQNIRKPSPGKGRNRRLNHGEEKRLMRACNQHCNPFFGWIVRLALYTAMRKGEIISLTRDQISMQTKTIFLGDTKTGDVRTVPLSGNAFKTIKQAVAHPIRLDDTDLIFYGEPNREGLRKPYTIGKVWRNALEHAEIEDFKFHDLRHEATSRFVEAGLSDQQVSSITGHKSMQMLKRYTRLRSENLVNMISDMQHSDYSL